MHRADIGCGGHFGGLQIQRIPGGAGAGMEALHQNGPQVHGAIGRTGNAQGLIRVIG